MEVKCASSFDERFDPKNVLDKDNMGTFWMTTGLYPQELLIQLNAPKVISEVVFSTQGAKKIVIEGCKQANAQTFTKIGESKDLPERSGLQSDSVTITDGAPCNLFKFIIAEGHDEFTSVHSISLK